MNRPVRDVEQREDNLYGLLATILAGVGILLLFTPIAIAGLLFSIAGFVLGLLGLKRDNQMVLAIIGTILGGLVIFLLLLSVVLVASLY